MTVDISQFYQIFFEEAAEHLATMESLLLTLDVTDPDIESLHAIFRAAHSIKGGAGTFGFNDMTELTHIMESLLDRLRNKELILVTEMIDTLLDSVDLLRQQLGKHQGSDDAVDPAMLKDSCIRLQGFISVSGGLEETAALNKKSSITCAQNGAITQHQVYTIRFIHVPKEVSWDGLEAEMARMGSVECVLQENDERVCVIETTASLDDLHESLGFVLRPEHYNIEKGRQIFPDVAKEDSGFGFFDEEFAVPEVLSSSDNTDSAPYVLNASSNDHGNILLDGIEEALIEVAKAKFASTDHVAGVLDEVELELLAAGIAASTLSCVNHEKNARLGYGFFKDNPGAPLELENYSIQSPDHDLGYGFFEDSPGIPNQIKEPESAAATKSLSSGHVIVDEVPPSKTKQEEKVPVADESRVGRRHGDKASGEVKMGRRAQDKVAAPATDNSSIRVSVEKVDQMLNLVGELVITQSMLMQIAGQMESGASEQLSTCLSQLDRNTRDLQESVMSIRMMPINFVFSRFPRVVRDLASRLGKQVELRLVGEGTELDRGLIEKISDPLTHLVRNSLDHGIEMPDVRRAQGKAEKGILTLAASHQGGHIVIEVQDDGGGLNRQKILEKARERGMVVSDELSDQDVWKLIFEAGFSTAAHVTDVSGRGVGMDVVKRNILALGGSVDIHSTEGSGTCITIHLPLTLAILDGMSVGVGSEVFIIPLASVIESLKPEGHHIYSISGDRAVLRVRDEYIPMLDLHDVFSIDKPKDYDQLNGIVVILEAHGKKAAVWVDQLLGQPQVVIKSLESNYRRVKGFSGATIMGDGRVALIIDVVAIVNAVSDSRGMRL